MVFKIALATIVGGTLWAQEPADAIFRVDSRLVVLHATAEDKEISATPGGLYFARLWYYEELYPLVFALQGLAGGRQQLSLT